MSANIDELKGIKATEGMLGCVLRDARSKGKTKKKNNSSSIALFVEERRSDNKVSRKMTDS